MAFAKIITVSDNAMHLVIHGLVQIEFAVKRQGSEMALTFKGYSSAASNDNLFAISAASFSHEVRSANASPAWDILLAKA